MGQWLCETPEQWKGTETEDVVMSDIRKEDGTEHEYGDRRQELVFIGMGLKHEAIQNLLDQCLLNDDEMKQGPEKWEEDMIDEDKIQLMLDDEEEEDEEGEGEDEVEQNMEEEEENRVEAEEKPPNAPD